MQHTIDISKLENPEKISDMCKKYNEPILIVDNKQENMIVMSHECFEKTFENQFKNLYK